MYFPILFLVEFAGIFFLSHFMSKILSHFFLHITRSHKVTIHLLSILFLPGVIVHELAHWITAGMLGVHTGEIEFMPKIEGSHVKLGSVAIASTDPFRRFFIGVAPILVGMLVLLGMYVFFFPDFQFVLGIKGIMYLYILFEVGNTMYSSSKDMEGALGFFVLSAFVILVLLVLGVRLPSGFFHVLFTPKVIDFFMHMDILLLLLACLDAAVWGLLKLTLHQQIKRRQKRHMGNTGQMGYH